MATALIRLGGITSHGGSVIEASGHCGNGNLGLVRTGGVNSCPIPGLGQNPIISGDISMLIDGSAGEVAGITAWQLAHYEGAANASQVLCVSNQGVCERAALIMRSGNTLSSWPMPTLFTHLRSQNP